MEQVIVLTTTLCEGELPTIKLPPTLDLKKLLDSNVNGNLLDCQESDLDDQQSLNLSMNLLGRSTRNQTCD